MHKGQTYDVSEEPLSKSIKIIENHLAEMHFRLTKMLLPLCLQAKTWKPTIYPQSST